MTTNAKRQELLKLKDIDSVLKLLETELENDNRIKVAGVDIDGILRGKVLSKEKFLASLKAGGFGMESHSYKLSISS